MHRLRRAGVLLAAWSTPALELRLPRAGPGERESAKVVRKATLVPQVAVVRE